jgi:hypothetical protein
MEGRKIKLAGFEVKSEFDTESDMCQYLRSMLITWSSLYVPMCPESIKFLTYCTAG